LDDRLVRVSRETRMVKQRSIRELRGCEEALTAKRRAGRAHPFGDSSVHITPRGSGTSASLLVRHCASDEAHHHAGSQRSEYRPHGGLIGPGVHEKQTEQP
ncbi:hypothetical protein R0K17_19260, partial [Planococcus sp. SIMBA_143]